MDLPLDPLFFLLGKLPDHLFTADQCHWPSDRCGLRQPPGPCLCTEPLKETRGKIAVLVKVCQGTISFQFDSGDQYQDQHLLLLSLKKKFVFWYELSVQLMKWFRYFAFDQIKYHQITCHRLLAPSKVWNRMTCGWAEPETGLYWSISYFQLIWSDRGSFGNWRSQRPWPLTCPTKMQSVRLGVQHLRPIVHGKQN